MAFLGMAELTGWEFLRSVGYFILIAEAASIVLIFYSRLDNKDF